MTEPNRRLKVFLCHAHSDADAVRALFRYLRREGVDPWLDKEKLLPGIDWDREIRKAVRESDVVVVCLSKQFNQAGYRQREVKIALDTEEEKPEGQIFIIPARLEVCDVPERLSKWQWVDLFEEGGRKKLIYALRERAESVGAALRRRSGGRSSNVAPRKKGGADDIRTHPSPSEDLLDDDDYDIYFPQDQPLSRRRDPHTLSLGFWIDDQGYVWRAANKLRRLKEPEALKMLAYLIVNQNTICDYFALYKAAHGKLFDGKYDEILDEIDYLAVEIRRVIEKNYKYPKYLLRISDSGYVLAD